jgi:hypothetical protein
MRTDANIRKCVAALGISMRSSYLQSMMSNHYRPPFSLSDLIVAAGSHRPGTLRDSLRAYADRLATVVAAADLSPADARTVATIVAWDVCHRDESAAPSATGRRHH